MIVVNFKTYKEATGNRAIELARICRAVQEKTKVRIVAVPQLADLRNCVETGSECWVQHVDFVLPGRNTGFVTIEDVQECGATGTLLNHSEHKVEIEKISESNINQQAVFEICVCASDESEVKRIMDGFVPDYLAYEPAELIGGTDKSVATEKPKEIEQIVAGVKIPVLVGAGIHTVSDVRVAVKLGARGVLVATGVVLAEDPQKVLEGLADGFI